ncbi:MAG TPA: hypothetical protein VIM06_03265 [Rhodanobacter sp.]
MHFPAKRSGNDRNALESLQPLTLELAASIHVDVVDAGHDHRVATEGFVRSGDRPGALAALRKALTAPPRAEQPLADAGRRRQIQALIQTINSTR